MPNKASQSVAVEFFPVLNDKGQVVEAWMHAPMFSGLKSYDPWHLMKLGHPAEVMMADLQ